MTDSKAPPAPSSKEVVSRLNAALEEEQRYSNDLYAKLLTDARDEIERLRSALTAIIANDPYCPDDPQPDHHYANRMAQLARRALSGEEFPSLDFMGELKRRLPPSAPDMNLETLIARARARAANHGVTYPSGIAAQQIRGLITELADALDLVRGTPAPETTACLACQLGIHKEGGRHYPQAGDSWDCAQKASAQHSSTCNLNYIDSIGEGCDCGAQNGTTDSGKP